MFNSDLIYGPAIRTKDGIIWALPKPLRHSDIILRMGRNGYRQVEGDVQGFLHINNTFLTREETQSLLEIKDEEMIGSILTSEDLW